MFIALAQRRALAIEELPEEAAVSVITTAELELGVHMADNERSRAQRLSTLLNARATYAPLAIDDSVASAFAELVAVERRAGRRPRVQDAWLAATARAHEIPVFTQDSGFDEFHGIQVVHV